MCKKKEEGISFLHLIQNPEWIRESPRHSGAETDSRLFDELKRGTLPEGLAELAIDELRNYAEEKVKRVKGTKKGGKKGGGHNKKINPLKVKKEFDAMSQPPRNRASILAERHGVTPNTIRNALKKAESD